MPKSCSPGTEAEASPTTASGVLRRPIRTPLVLRQPGVHILMWKVHCVMEPPHVYPPQRQPVSANCPSPARVILTEEEEASPKGLSPSSGKHRKAQTASLELLLVASGGSLPSASSRTQACGAEAGDTPYAWEELEHLPRFFRYGKGLDRLGVLPCGCQLPLFDLAEFLLKPDEGLMIRYPQVDMPSIRSCPVPQTEGVTQRVTSSATDLYAQLRILVCAHKGIPQKNVEQPSYTPTVGCYNGFGNLFMAA